MKIRSFGIVMCGVLIAGSRTSAGQEPPPISAVTGTIALDGTVQKVYGGLNTIIVKTEDGVEHLFHLEDRTEVHGGDALRGIEQGSTVAVHYTRQGDKEVAHEVDRLGGDGLPSTEGVVTKVDRTTQTISIRLADGSEQKLRLTERAAAESGSAASDLVKVVVYFSDESGRRVVHYFRRVS